MHVLHRALIILSLAGFATLAAEQQTPVRDRAVSPAGTGAIRGRVVALDTNRPLRVARMVLAGDAPFQPQFGVTDNDGRYEFRNLPAGRFTLSAASDAYITLSYGQTRPSQTGKLLTLADRQVVDDVNFGLPLGGVITGTIRDEFNDPVIGAGVTPMQVAFRDGRRLIVAAGPVESTNDLGEFRVSGLQPGSYYLEAKKTLSGMPIGAVIRSNLSALPVYAPGTPTVADARRISVELGRAVTGVDVVVSRVRTATITGTVVDFGGRPERWAYAVLVRPGVVDPIPLMAEQGMNPGITSGFTFSGVPSGTYEIRGVANGFGGPLPPGTTPYAAITRVTVSGEHIKDLPLTPFAASRVSGRIVVDPAVASTLPIAAFGLSLRSADPAEPYMWVAHLRPIRVAQDLSINMFALPGRWVVFPSTDGVGQGLPAMPKGWAIQAVRLGGADVTDGFEVRQGFDVRDLEIELTNHPPEISGTVRTANGAMADDYTVLIFARDRARWNGNSRYFAMARPDQSGRYSVSTLAPGDYYAVALEYVDVNEAQDPELLDRVSKDATPFTLGDGEQKQLELKLIP